MVPGSSFNFITQCFFLTSRCLSLGLLPACRKCANLERHFSHVHHRGDHEQASRVFAHFRALRAQVGDPELLEEALRFMCLAADWFIGALLPGDQPLDASLTLPLPSPPPELIGAVPQYFLEDMVDLLGFVEDRGDPTSVAMLGRVPLHRIVDLVIVLLGSPNLIHNPHIRTKLAKALVAVHQAEVCDDLLRAHPLGQKYLSSSLLAAYGDAGQLDFYDQAPYRKDITTFLRWLWQSKEHYSQFRAIADDEQGFMSFANSIINHINSLVSESLDRLPDIKDMMQQLADAALPAEEREALEGRLDESEQICKMEFELANETLALLRFISAEIQELFLRPELVERMASMLVSLLRKLAGPRNLDLKVDNPDRYNFKPKEMLNDVVTIFLHFEPYADFHRACSHSAFYDADMMRKAARTVQRLNLVGGAENDKLKSMLQAIDSASIEVDLGEIPDEFLDPLLQTLMLDPVTLPSSGTVVDRPTIMQHLLNDSSDPFSRAPLKADELQPNDELKARIEAFVKERTAAAPPSLSAE